MGEIGRILVALGSVTAAVAFTFWGLALAYHDPVSWLITASIWGMVVGVIGAVVGFILYRANFQAEAEEGTI